VLVTRDDCIPLSVPPPLCLIVVAISDTRRHSPQAIRRRADVARHYHITKLQTLRRLDSCHPTTLALWRDVPAEVRASLVHQDQ